MKLTRAVRRFPEKFPPALAELGHFESAHDQAEFVAKTRHALTVSPQAAYAQVRALLEYPNAFTPAENDLVHELELWLARQYRTPPKETP